MNEKQQVTRKDGRTVEVTIPQDTEFEPGCYFDNHRGIYMGEAVIEFAEHYGYKPDETQRHADSEFYCEEWDSAENYMNEHYGQPGFFWGATENGDWGFWKAEDWD